jgi:acyl-coenzyme A thioesterase PaaI-like protein
MNEASTVFLDNDFCFACGGKNPLGLHLQFFRDGDMFCTRVTPKPHWQGFAGVVHGGLQSTIIDDLMSNHLFRLEQAWVTTGELSLRFRKPVPIDQELLFASRVESHQGRVWNMLGDCRLAGERESALLTTARGRFIDIPPPGK